MSLAENVVRVRMHPADEYEAYAFLHNGKGMAAEDIAAQFGVQAGLVRQRLKLGAVSPKLMALYRDGQLTLAERLAAAGVLRHPLGTPAEHDDEEIKTSVQ